MKKLATFPNHSPASRQATPGSAQKESIVRIEKWWLLMEQWSPLNRACLGLFLLMSSVASFQSHGRVWAEFQLEGSTLASKKLLENKFKYV